MFSFLKKIAAATAKPATPPAARPARLDARSTAGPRRRACRDPPSRRDPPSLLLIQVARSTGGARPGPGPGRSAVCRPPLAAPPTLPAAPRPPGPHNLDPEAVHCPPAKTTGRPKGPGPAPRRRLRTAARPPLASAPRRGRRPRRHPAGRVSARARPRIGPGRPTA
jgi:translation initiation factor IF-2